MTPPFDQTAIDRRFLEEVYRLHAAGAFTTFTELASALQVHRGIISEIESERYHCNLKLFYLLQATYQADARYILTGHSDQLRPPVVVRPAISSERPIQNKPR
jgi:DNA-binding XRE family transcriptional regulator